MIETIISAFAFGTIWFWLLVTITSIVVIASIENEHYFTPSALVLLLGIMSWKSFTNMSWQAIATTIVGYLIIGIVWSLYKWHRHVTSVIAYNIKDSGSWQKATERYAVKHTIEPAHNKGKLIGWIAWWPWSLFWNLSGDFFNIVYDGMVNAYQKITDNALKKLTEPSTKV